LFSVLILLTLTSGAMYYFENPVQPEAFSSIPAAMWWGTAALTTVGYGDVYPVTVGGRILGAVTAILGIGFFALPAGILASGFSDAMQRSRRGTGDDCDSV
jgi:voltage-gated potassium channel